MMNSQELHYNFLANQLSPHPDNVILDESLDHHAAEKVIKESNLKD